MAKNEMELEAKQEKFDEIYDRGWQDGYLQGREDESIDWLISIPYLVCRKEDKESER